MGLLDFDENAFAGAEYGEISAFVELIFEFARKRPRDFDQIEALAHSGGEGQEFHSQAVRAAAVRLLDIAVVRERAKNTMDRALHLTGLAGECMQREIVPRL